MNRETITVTLPVSNTEVVLNKYLIGREKRALANVYLDQGVKFDADGKNISGFGSKVADIATNLAWTTVVVSIAGKSDNIVEDILNLVDTDYEFVVAKVNEISNQKKTTGTV